jgi:hypothetical protein
MSDTKERRVWGQHYSQMDWPAETLSVRGNVNARAGVTSSRMRQLASYEEGVESKEILVVTVVALPIVERWGAGKGESMR